MNPFTKALAIAFVMTNLASTAHANVTYTYQGNLLDGYGGALTPIEMSFTFESAITNWDNVTGTGLLNWQLSQQTVGLLTDVTTQVYLDTPYKPMFSFQTNNGNIVSWYVAAYTAFDGTPYWKQNIFSINNLTYPNPNGGVFSSATPMDYAMLQDISPTPHSNFVGINYSSGFWTTSITPVPESSSSAMLLTGLGVMGFAVRSRNKSKA